MVYLVEGKVHPGHKGNIGPDGKYLRAPTVHRGTVEPDSEFPPEADRYRLYVSPACGWSHRVMLLRSLKRLDTVVPITFVHPKRHDAEGWHFERDVDTDGTLADTQDPAFPECTTEPLFGVTHLHQIYTLGDPKYSGNVTVPVLFDSKTQRIVANESEVIMRILDSAFNDFTDVKTTYHPAELRDSIDRVNDLVYNGLSNGVYKAGFAKSQEVYETACHAVFDTLAELEKRLDTSRYLCGSTLTEADLRLFVTLIRFDPVYYGHFKVNLRRIAWYPNLSNYLRDVYQTRGVAETVFMEHYKTHYYWSHESINPKRRIPKGGVPNHSLPHNRARFDRAALAAAGSSDAGLAGVAPITKGEFVRPDSRHRNQISASGATDYPVEAGRYHLYIA